MKRQLVNLTQQDSRQRFQREFYSQNSVDLGRALLGKVLVRKLPSGELLRGTIVETEAYPGTEEASLLLNVHCFITKQTEKNAGIFMEAGTTWVYLTYGVFNMINVSALRKSILSIQLWYNQHLSTTYPTHRLIYSFRISFLLDPGSACLLRAIEPKDDGFLDLMERLRLHKKPKMVAPLVLTFTDHTSAGSSRITRTRQGKQNPEIPKIAVEPDASNPNEDPADEVTPSVSSFKSKLKAHELANGPGKLCKVRTINGLEIID